MSRFASCILSVLFAAFPAAQLAAQANSPAVLTPGEWEITIQTQSPVTTPPTVTLVCLTKDDERPKPPKGRPTDDCQVAGGAALTGNVLAYSVKCGKKKSASTARFTYSGDSFEGVVTVTTEVGDVLQTHTGRRIGACDSGTVVP